MKIKGRNTKDHAPDHPTQLGAAIRLRRKALGKTLLEIANESNLTTGFISQVERGISSPSLASLMTIASSLQTSIEQLLSVPEEFSPYVSRNTRQTYSLGLNGRLYEKLGPGFPGALFYPAIIHRPPGHVSEHMCHTGEVFCHIMAGKIEYHLGGSTYVMTEGDTIHHDTTTSHYSKVISETESIELWVSSTPIRNIKE
jgi:transcriptional regulator with XRE-family HTH domain